MKDLQTNPILDHAAISVSACVRGVTPQTSRVERVSVVVPVRNEESSIERLIDGLLEQTRQPSEIVITDGGSDDRTREIIRTLQKSSPVPIVLIETDHALPGRGRNLGIASAADDWIACIDAGITPHVDWLKELVASAEHTPEAEVIYGRYEAVTDSYFTECAAITYAPAPGELTRSIASCLLRRSAWEVAGGFREDLRSAEDLLFFRSLEKAKVRAAYSRDAVVYWSLQPSVGSTFRRMRHYSRHNIKAGLASEWQFRVSRLYALMLLALVGGVFWPPLFLLPPLIHILRAERRVQRWYRGQTRRRLWIEMLNPRRVLTVMWINVVIDMAMFHGMLKWLMHDRWGVADKS